MNTLDTAVFNQNIESTRIALREGVLSINIWDRKTGLTLAEWQGNPTGVALLTQLLADLEETLADSHLSEFDNYLYMDLEDNQGLVILNHGDDLMQGWLIDATRTNPGILLGMAVPAALSNIAAAKK